MTRLPAIVHADVRRAAAWFNLPTEDLPVEVEYEAGVISQAPLAGVSVVNGALQLQLGAKHTDCLAKDVCLPNGCCGSGETACCS